MKNNYNVLEIIQMAINTEREGYEFYSNIAKQTSDEKAKAIFIILAEQEKKHSEIFTNLLEVMSKNSHIDGDYLFDENVIGYFNALTEQKVFKQERMDNAKHMTSTKEALQEGINAEKNSILLYNELLNGTTIPEVISALELIIQEEKRHIIDLTNIAKTL